MTLFIYTYIYICVFNNNWYQKQKHVTYTYVINNGQLEKLTENSYNSIMWQM